MKFLFKKYLQHSRTMFQGKCLALWALINVFTANTALADLPKMEDPSRGAGKGVIETIKNYAYDAGILAGLLISAVAFYQVASSCLATYREISDGKKKWSDLGMTALVGAILIVIIIWLLTKAADIL
ncbi:TIGR03745 family integrating conjugative element membrane protein [Testudinibacter sp. P80/BLE/0925]|uniref:TIGR03745 family integrating conjugative element membrane protein n=1 Tax=Testudinibacter sp. TW-1 TaxID=3417757 RepID=UPI003D35F444